MLSISDSKTLRCSLIVFQNSFMLCDPACIHPSFSWCPPPSNLFQDETFFVHRMRPDNQRSRDPRRSSQPTEDQPHRDPRPATRSPESGDPKEAGDQGANRQRQVTTQPEFRRGAKRQESRRLGVQRHRADSSFGQALEVRATAANIQERVL